MENGGHKAEVSVSAVPTYACCLTPWPGSTTCQTPTGEPGRWGRGSETVPAGLRLKSTSTRRPTLPSVRHLSAASPQVSAVPPLWTTVQTKHTPPMAQQTPKMNPSLSARFTPQVPSTAPFTPLQETRALLNVPFTQTKQTQQQTAPSTLQGLTTAQTVPFTPQGRLQTAPCIPQGHRMAKATMTVPCMGKGPSQNHPQTAHFTPQGFKSASAHQNRTPRRRRPKQGTIGSKQGETRAA